MRSRAHSLRTITFHLVVCFVAAGSPAASQQTGVTTPEAFFGFQLGTDQKMARWDRIVEYYELLEKESDKITVTNMGSSTMGHPFLLVIISSPANIANLEHLREVNSKISDPRGLTEESVKELVSEGKVVICQSMSLHATEIGGTQMAPELTYDLLTRDDRETKRILDNVIFLMVPSLNPDGQIMVTDWYRKTLGTEYEGVNLPWLYHEYVGHDNNRDSFQTNTIESQYMAKVMFTDWKPQAYVDHHHMGSYGARFYVPPYSEPIRPYADPLIWREHAWYGGHIAYKLEQHGKPGVLNAAQYPGWGHFGWHWIAPFHNIAGMLTESASARLATPLYIHPEQLKGGVRAFPAYEAQATFPAPWPGGWWKLRDIVEQQKISAWAVLDMGARNKETVLWNAYLKATRQSQRGERSKPAGYVIPKSQHDPLTTIKLINKLLVQGIEVQRAQEGFTSDGRAYPAGSYVISLAQPKMGLIRNLLGRTLYPDNEWSREKDGSPLRPYDSTTHTMAEYMGVRVDPVDESIEGDFTKLTEPVTHSVEVARGDAGYLLDGRLNDSFKAVNLLLDEGVEVRRVQQTGTAGLRPGDFVVPAAPESALSDIATQTGVDFNALEVEPREGVHDVKRLRIGMYQRYWGGNMDEGWTRFILEQFAFPYTTLKDEDFKNDALEERFDVVILPNDATVLIVGEGVEDWFKKNRPGRPVPAFPPEYRSGIGEEGVEALKSFVEKGGTLVTLGGATAFAIEKFGLNVRNVVENVDRNEFFCPGSTLKVKFDNSHPLAYGMPSEGLVLHWNSPAFEIIPSRFNDRYKTIVRYADRDILQSGWLIGEQYLSGKAGMIEAQYGEGQVVLIGFRTQNRGQTHGTFKLLFNALLR
jgi:hypothetical protein